MKKVLMLIAVLSLASSVRAAGLKAGDGLGTLSLGAGQVGGHDGDFYKAGLLVGGEYLHHHSPALAYGGEVTLHAPGSKTKDFGGTGNRKNFDGRFISVLATGRFNLTPAASSTPYAALGLGMAQHQLKEVTTPIAGGPSAEAKHDFWRMTAALRLGWDCLAHEKWIAGVEVRYQYLDKLMQTYGASFRLGWRY